MWVVEVVGITGIQWIGARAAAKCDTGHRAATPSMTKFLECTDGAAKGNEDREDRGNVWARTAP